MAGHASRAFAATLLTMISTSHEHERDSLPARVREREA
jgi:hypothetical protein